MATVTVNLADFKQSSRDLQQFMQSGVSQVIKRAAEDVGVTFDDAVKKKLPPAPRPRKVSKYWTEKQRAWWWATMRAKANGQSNELPGWSAKWRKVAGKRVLVISGHYKRTGVLVRSLTYTVTQSGDMTTVRYGTNVQYAKWVIDLDNQSKYHQGQWLTLQTELQRQTPLLRDVFANSVFEQTREALGG